MTLKGVMRSFVILCIVTLTWAGQEVRHKKSDDIKINTNTTKEIHNDKPRFEYLRLGDFIDPLKKKYPREVTKLIFVTNGGPRGDWQRPQFCPKGTYAAGYELKLEDAMWFKSDDTSLNAVSLKCVKPRSYDYEGNIISMEGPWGVWKDPVDCLNADGQNYFFVGFNLKMEKSRGIRDDTAANNVKFKCRLLNQYRHYELEGRGGPWGKWGDWSENCPMGSAVCGIQVKMHEPQGPKDDTSLNDIRLFCCKDEKEDERSREEWIKLCDVKVQTGPGRPTPRTPDRERTDGRRPNNRERFDNEGNRIWPPTKRRGGDRVPANYRGVDGVENIYPGLKEDMESTEVFVHEFN